MADSLPSLAQATTDDAALRAGWRLRRIRERLNLTLRAVEEATLEIAEAEKNSDYFVSVARLNQIENDGSLPSIYKLYSLAVVFQWSAAALVSPPPPAWKKRSADLIALPSNLLC